MSLVALLTDKPSERAEHDKLVTDARAEGRAAVTAEMKAVIDKVKPILASPDYSKAVKECGIKAITGETSVDAFDAVVVMADEQIEIARAKEAEGETDDTGETGANGTGGGGEAADADYLAKKERLKGKGV